jgi:hypothetical protein
MSVLKIPRPSLLKTLLEHIFPELANIYLSRDIKSVSELYGQLLYSVLLNCVYVGI